MKKATIILIIFPLLTISAHPAIITVALDDSADYNNIQAAIDAAIDGDEIIVKDGTYTGDGNRRINFNGKSITLRSQNGKQNCLIECNDFNPLLARAFSFENNEGPDSILEGFTILKGGGEPGGAIYCLDSSPTIRNCTFRFCRTTTGGAIACQNSSPEIKDCLFQHNSLNMHHWTASPYGGAIYINQGNPVISGCQFIQNYAHVLFSHEGEIFARGWGGAIYIKEGSANISNSNFFGNKSSHSGGAIEIKGNSDGAYINGCVFEGNIAETSSHGCSIVSSQIPITISNSVFINNHAPLWKNIICSDNGSIKNCIIWEDYPLPVSESISATYSCIKGGFPGEGNIDMEPMFADPENGDFHLKSQLGRWNPATKQWIYDDVTSPCIDAGNPDSPWQTELYPHGRRINMGAYANTPQASMSPSTAGNIADLNHDNIVSLQDFATLANKWQQDQILLAPDFDRNGSVNIYDLVILANNWLQH